MKKVLVTGAGGFIGKVLTYKLAALGYFVYAIVLTEKEKENLSTSKNIQPIVGDIMNDMAIQSQIDSTVDMVYHLAWIGIAVRNDYKNIEIQKENVALSLHTFRLAESLKAKKFIFVSSNQEYLLDYNTINGMDCLSSVYGVCKHACRNICSVLARNKMEFCSTAFTNVFGVGDTSKRTANFFIAKLLREENLDLIEGTHSYDWIYIDDAVDGLIAVGEKGITNKFYYIGNRNLKTFREILEQVQQILSPNSRLNFGMYHDTSYTDYNQFDMELLYQDTGFMCSCDFKESILKTAEWVKTLNL